MIEKSNEFELGFYINYEECKYHMDCNRNWASSCFILTMRNVNTIYSWGENRQIESFILTMRNVNPYGREQVKWITKGFILTMRNVNLT